MTSTAPDRETRLAELFVKLSDTLVSGFDIVDLLGDLTEGSVVLLGVSSAGILLTDQRGHLRAMASSNETARSLALLELQSEQGPCLECFRTSAPVLAPDVSLPDERWPRFTAAAVEAGVGAAYAVPMRLRADTLGALNLFCDGEARSEADSPDLRLAQALADAATIAVLNHRAISQQTRISEQLQTALNSRIVIEQAKGAISVHTGGDMGEAFRLLRGYARSHQENLTLVAEAFVTGQLRFQSLFSTSDPAHRNR